FSATAPSLPTTTRTPTSTGTPQPLSGVHVRSYNLIYTSSGFALYLAGEVVNDLFIPVYFVRLNLKFLNAAGQEVASEFTYATLTRINPGQRVPFVEILLNPPGDITRVTFEVEYMTDAFLDYQPLTIVSQAKREGPGDGFELYGTVRNDQTRELDSVELAATLYDETGNVVDAWFGFPSSITLAPGATATYSIYFSPDRRRPFSTFTIQGQGYLKP
ncbi:MAG: FxLYD domain-containing protein, partial [Anaerolineae bacterium]|nr:FxLYD domain-containing protein [Anaerolineae bacterium]